MLKLLLMFVSAVSLAGPAKIYYVLGASGTPCGVYFWLKNQGYQFQLVKSVSDYPDVKDSNVPIDKKEHVLDKVAFYNEVFDRLMNNEPTIVLARSNGAPVAVTLLSKIYAFNEKLRAFRLDPKKIQAAYKEALKFGFSGNDEDFGEAVARLNQDSIYLDGMMFLDYGNLWDVTGGQIPLFGKLLADHDVRLKPSFKYLVNYYQESGALGPFSINLLRSGYKPRLHGQKMFTDSDDLISIGLDFTPAIQNVNVTRNDNGSIAYHLAKEEQIIKGEGTGVLIEHYTMYECVSDYPYRASFKRTISEEEKKYIMNNICIPFKSDLDNILTSIER